MKDAATKNESEARRAAPSIVAAIMGALAGLVVSAAIGSMRNHQNPVEIGPTGQPAVHIVHDHEAADPDPRIEAMRREIAGLRGRVAEVESRAAQREDAGQADPPPAPSETGNVAPVDEHARMEEMVGSHTRETLDPTWAPTMTAAVNRRLEGVANRFGFSVVETDCRSETCLTTVHWNDPGAAHTNFYAFMLALVDTDCGRSGWLGDGTGAGNDSEAKLLFTCREQSRQ